MREVLADGNRLMLTIVAEPVAPEKHLLMGVMELPTDHPENSDRSYEQIAQSEGKTLVSVNAPRIAVNGAEGNGGSADFVYQQDKLIYYIEESGLPLADGTLSIACTFIDYEVYGSTETKYEDGSTSNDVDAGTPNRSEAVFTVAPAQTSSGTLRFNGPFACELMDVHWVELERTSTATYLRIEYTVQDQLTEEDREAMELMYFKIVQSATDETFTEGGAGGKVVVDVQKESGPSDGTTRLGETYWEQPDRLTFLEETIWPAQESFPETIYLRPYYKLAGQWGAAIELHTAEGVQ